MADALSAITEHTGLNLIVDADTGFGNALNVQRIMRLFERCGAAAQSDAQMQAIAARFKGRVPLMANMVESGRTPQKTAAELEAPGFALVIFPGGMVRAVARTMRDYAASLARHGTNQPYHDRMLSFDELNQMLGTPGRLEMGARYDAANFGGDDD